ncbi:MAG: hypothetical protein ACO1RX_06205 [Candidatus Sericytochromatia bacterium]
MFSSPRFARRVESFNVVLFVFFALAGYVQYFMHDSPPERSLYLGLAFTVILVLYMFLLQHRRKQRR